MTLRFTLLLILALTAICFAEENTVFQDSFLTPQMDGYETTTLGEIYLALPQAFFETTYRQRIDFLLRGWIEFDSQKHEIRVPEDGGQQKIVAVVTKQTKDSLVLDVTLETEGEKTYWTLERGNSRWIGTQKQK